jgi:hypothetical protein
MQCPSLRVARIGEMLLPRPSRNAQICQLNKKFFQSHKDCENHALNLTYSNMSFLPVAEPTFGPGWARQRTLSRAIMLRQNF